MQYEDSLFLAGHGGTLAADGVSPTQDAGPSVSEDMSIGALLRQRGARLVGEGGDPRRARERADVTMELAARYEGWDRLRSHIFNPQNHPRLVASEATRCVAHALQARGWIRPLRRDGSAWAIDGADEDADRYLRGAWLEEYAWLACIEAGCDEAYFGQQLQWSVDGVLGHNEIDVIARRGPLLSFTSCKCIKPRHVLHSERLREFLNEIAYWDWHFADRNARALLVTTADLIDELAGDVHRYPTVMARAKVLDIEVAGLEQLAWPRLVQSMREHWA